MPAHHRAVRRYLIISLVSFIGSCAICISIRPDLFDHPDYGISFFGSIAKTLIPYVLGLLITAWCLRGIARELRPFPSTKPLRGALLLSALLLVCIVLTPMALSPAVFWSHIAISAILGLTQIAMVVWILLRSDPGPIDYLLALVLLPA